MGGVAAAASAALAWPARAFLSNDEPGPDELLAFFRAGALTRRRRNGRGTFPGWVRKWQAPVVVQMTGLAEPEYRQALAAVLDDVSTFSGVSFRLSDRKVRVDNDVVVQVRSADSMTRWKGGRGVVCRTSTSGIGGAIQGGRVEVSDAFTDCLRHEFMHVLGFDNHWTGQMATSRLPSVLAPRWTPARAPRYSAPDETAIRLLYDSRLVPGTRREPAIAIAREILDAKFHHWYADAVSRVERHRRQTGEADA